ncbi:hypothetical protein KJQ85_08980, partial [Campylobacter lari]
MEIRNFIEMLKKFDEKIIEKECIIDDFTDEFRSIVKIQKEKNISKMIEFWGKQISNKYFEIEHPFYKNIKTRAVYNIADNKASNIVFMIDKENKYPWIFTQASLLINYIIVPGAFYKIQCAWPIPYTVKY